MPAYREVCRESEVVEGRGKMVVLDQVMIGLFRIGDEIYAIENECPHAGASLAHGVVDGDTVACRIHHWRFRIYDGAYLDEKRPACDRRTFPVRVVEGMVHVEV